MTVRFLHTADWQLGMTRHFLDADAQARYTEARFAAVRSLGRVAAERGCSFVVVAGDVFETNQVGRDVVARACEALAQVPVPVLLLPGNHDPLDGGSVLASERLAQRMPGTVQVLDGTPVRIGDVEVVSAPWRSKRPLEDLAALACADLSAVPGLRRVLVAHGAVESFGSSAAAAAIDLSRLEALVEAGAVDVVCLGDRHSTTEVGSSGRVWYAGTPEVTDYDEVDPGNVLVVELDGTERGGEVSVTPVRVGEWRFVAKHVRLDTDEDVAGLEKELDELPDKSRTALKLSLVGSVSLAQKARVDELLDHASDLLAALQVWERRSDLVVLPDDLDHEQLGLTGFARDAAAELAARARGLEGEAKEAVRAQDALSLLYRLAGPR